MRVAWIDEAGRLWADGIQMGSIGPSAGPDGVKRLAEQMGFQVGEMPPWFFAPAYSQKEKERRADELAKRAWDLHRQGYGHDHILKACGWKNQAAVASAICRFEGMFNK